MDEFALFRRCKMLILADEVSAHFRVQFFVVLLSKFIFYFIDIITSSLAAPKVTEKINKQKSKGKKN